MICMICMIYLTCLISGGFVGHVLDSFRDDDRPGLK
jgi:hypothetical protein